jgi:hypothetical protein
VDTLFDPAGINGQGQKQNVQFRFLQQFVSVFVVLPFENLKMRAKGRGDF